MDFRSRSSKLIGTDGLMRLEAAKVAVFGLGGVGSWATEALVRTGVGQLFLCDGDCVDISNINRQLPALESTVGQLKTSVMEARMMQINGQLRLELHPAFYKAGDGALLDRIAPDYILDCIDDVKAKVDLIASAYLRGIPILSATGCGRRLDPSKLKLCDLFETHGDPLCKILRKELRDLKIPKLSVVFSQEPILPNTAGKKPLSGPGSLPFVPASAGLLMAHKAVMDLLEGPKEPHGHPKDDGCHEDGGQN